MLKVALRIVPLHEYGKQLTIVARNTGIEELTTPRIAPKANTICERSIGRLKRECLDRMLIFHQKQVRRVVEECAEHVVLLKQIERTLYVRDMCPLPYPKPGFRRILILGIQFRPCTTQQRDPP